MKIAEVKGSTFAVKQATQYGLEKAFMSDYSKSTSKSPKVEVRGIHLSRTSCTASPPPTPSLSLFPKRYLTPLQASSLTSPSPNEPRHLLPPYDLHSPSFSPNPALAWCPEHSHPALLPALLSRGASLSTPHNGCVPLTRAAKAGHSQTILALHPHHTSIHTPTTSAGNTALMLASKNGHVNAVKTLLALGADVGARNGEGWTALHFAAKEGREEVVTVLVGKGAERECENGRGETAGDLAVAFGHWGVAGILVD